MDSENISINASSGASYMNNPKRTETTPLQGGQHENRGLHVIISCLTVLTAIVSVALAAQMYYGDNRILFHGSIVTDRKECSTIGADILKRGGNAVDAAIAAVFCMGVVYPHLTGIGGGGVMLIYDQHSSKPLDCLDFQSSKSTNSIVGVPGQLAGLYGAHLAYGKLDWSLLVEPSIIMSRTGFLVSESLLNSFAMVNLTASESLKNWLGPIERGSIMKALNLSDTLETIAKHGADVFYNGSLSDQLYGYISSNNLKNYQVGRGDCTEHFLGGYKFVVPGSRTGGPFLVKALSNLNISQPHNMSLLEILSNLKGDEELNYKQSSGISVIVMDDSDMYVSLVSGLGPVFGSQIVIQGSYILNSVESSYNVEENVIKKQVSLSTPIVIVENGKICGRRLVTGNDARDLVQLLYRFLNTALSNEDLQLSVEAPRARLLSKSIEIEGNHTPSFQEQELELIKSEGYTIANATYPYPSLNVIQKVIDTMFGYSDLRGQGFVETF